MDRNVKAIFLSLIIVCFSISNQAIAKFNKTKSQSKNFDKHKYFYTSGELCEFAAKFNNEKEIVLKGVKFMVGGSDTISSLRIKVYGNEGGANVPRYSQELIAPIKIIKEKPGIQELEVTFPTSIRISQNGYFISFDSLVGNVSLISSKNEVNCFCSSPNSGSYYQQAIKDTHNNWYAGQYAFAVLPVYEVVDDKKGNYFNLVELDDSLNLAVNNVIVADINSDSKPDLILDGKCYDNIDDFKFKLNKNYIINDSVIFQAVIDVDNDGYHDVLVLCNRDSVTKELQTILYRNASGKFKRIPLNIKGIYHPQNIICEDANNDNYDDIVISHKADSANDIHSSIFLNDRNLSFYELTKDIKGNDFKLPPSKMCSIMDYNKDGIKEIVFIEQAGKISSYNIQDNALRENTELRFQNYLDSVYAINNPLFYPTDLAKDNVSIMGKDGIVISSSSKSALVHPTSNTMVIEDVNENQLLNVDSQDFKFQEIQSGICTFDINNDGLGDIIILTGDTCRPPDLYIASAEYGYRTASLFAGFNTKNIGSDAITSDINMDGKIDLVSIYNNKLKIFKNTYTEVEDENHFIIIKSDPSNSLKSVTLSISDTLYDYVATSMSAPQLQSMQSAVCFGLAKNQKVDNIKVYTSDDHYFEREDLLVDQTYTLDDFTKKIKNLEPEIIAWPIPFSNQIEFRVTNPPSDCYKLSIKDNSGKVVYSESSFPHSSNNVYSWNGYNEAGVEVPNGVYYLELKSDHFNKHIKIIKLR